MVVDHHQPDRLRGCQIGHLTVTSAPPSWRETRPRTSRPEAPPARGCRRGPGGLPHPRGLGQTPGRRPKRSPAANRSPADDPHPNVITLAVPRRVGQQLLQRAEERDLDRQRRVGKWRLIDLQGHLRAAVSDVIVDHSSNGVGRRQALELGQSQAGRDRPHVPQRVGQRRLELVVLVLCSWLRAAAAPGASSPARASARVHRGDRC